MELLKRLNYLYASAGRLLDFSGSYNRDLLMQRLSVPGYLRDREAFLADREEKRICTAQIERLKGEVGEEIGIFTLGYS